MIDKLRENLVDEVKHINLTKSRFKIEYEIKSKQLELQKDFLLGQIKEIDEYKDRLVENTTEDKCDICSRVCDSGYLQIVSIAGSHDEHRKYCENCYNAHFVRKCNYCSKVVDTNKDWCQFNKKTGEYKCTDCIQAQ